MLMWNLPIAAIVTVIAVFGWGIHGPLHNSISMVALFLCYTPGSHFAYPWHMTVLMASTLAAHRVEEVHEAVRRRPSVEDWEASVAQPATELVYVMQTLSGGWGRGMLIFSLHLLLLSMFFVLLALAPVSHHLSHNQMLPAVDSYHVLQTNWYSHGGICACAFADGGYLRGEDRTRLGARHYSSHCCLFRHHDTVRHHQAGAQSCHDFHGM